jgi:ribonuclease Z
MNFEVTILGTGSAIPTKDRFLSGQVVNHDEHLFLIDCGEGTQIQLRRFKKSFNRISYIFISHLHADHYLGLPGLLSSMDLLGRTTPITIFCPKGLDELMALNFKISHAYPKYPINWVFTDHKDVNLLLDTPKLEVYSFPLRHRIPCTGFWFKEKKSPRKFDKNLLKKYFILPDEIIAIKNGADYTAPDGEFYRNEEITIEPNTPRSYAYCSDTIFLPELSELLKGTNVIYHEATFGNELESRAKATFHSTALQAAEIASTANAGKLYIGHFSSRYTDAEVLAEEARTIFPNTEKAVEGLTFPVE